MWVHSYRTVESGALHQVTEYCSCNSGMECIQSTMLYLTNITCCCTALNLHLMSSGTIYAFKKSYFQYHEMERYCSHLHGFLHCLQMLILHTKVTSLAGFMLSYARFEHHIIPYRAREKKGRKTRGGKGKGFSDTNY